MEQEKLIQALSLDRLEADLEALACIGAKDGGVTRLGFTAAEREAHQWAAERMRQAGLRVQVDNVGNTIGTKTGTVPDFTPILVGSHLDTVADGGRFDGAVGVVAGLELARALAEANLETRHPLEVVVFAGEEAVRFGEGTLGSQVVTSQLGYAGLFRIADTDGVTLAAALAALHLPAEGIPGAVRRSGEIAAYVELHVEQSSVLERLGRTVGLVGAIAGPTRLVVTLEGEQNHSGATPMTMRRDALAAAAEIVLAAEEIALHQAGSATVATVGVLEVSPGSMSVIPGHVRMGIDIRDVDELSKEAAVAKIHQAISSIATKRGIQFGIEIPCDRQPQVLAAELIDVAAAVCERLGISYHRMNSGAGHDAQHMARITPTALLFIPSVGGISHSPQEFTESRHIWAGTQVLAGLVLAIDSTS